MDLGRNREHCQTCKKVINCAECGKPTVWDSTDWLLFLFSMFICLPLLLVFINRMTAG